MQAKFTQPGNAGAKFKNQYEKLVKSLSLPKGAKEELGIAGDEGMGPLTVDPAPKEEDSDNEEAIAARANKAYEKEMTHRIFNEGRYHIIPSFFRTLMYLKKQKKEFAVVFRTFGVDLDNVVYELNRFCNGNHPCFNGRNNTPLVKMDGAKNSKDFRFKVDEQRAQLYRLGDGINETLMVVGNTKRVEGMD